MDELEVLYEDRYFIAVNKGPGVPAQPDKSGDEPLSERVRRYLSEHGAGAEAVRNGGSTPDAGTRRAGSGSEKPGTPYLEFPHRIDRPTSGVVLFAKSRRALIGVSKLFADNAVKKLYWAAVDNPPPAGNGTLVHWLRFDRRLNKSFARGLPPGAAEAGDASGVHDAAAPGRASPGGGPAGGKPPRGEWKKAVLHYRLAGRSERFFFLEIELETGRHHQIRAQLARAGCRIKGDVKYGFPRTNPGGGIHLHARSIAFAHPVTGEPLTITADPPADPVWNAFPREPSPPL